MLFHAGFPLFGGGFVGVDVFFVISGYLITSIIMAELDAGNFSIIKFYERRARRILPALFLVLAACLPFAWLWLLPSDMKGFAQSLVAVTTFSSNVLFWRQSGYFDSAAELKPLLHTWSLAVEEQFYVLFPLLLMVFWRRDRRWLLGLLAGLTLLSFGLAQWGAANSPTAAFFLLPARGWELALGAACAWLLARRQGAAATPLARQVLAATGLLLIAVSIFCFTKDTPFPGAYALLPTMGTALIILYADAGTATGALLGSQALVGVGLVSYSAYLWHQPLLAFARQRAFDVPVAASMAGLVVLSLVLAYLSWRYVERPFRDRSKFGRARIFGFALAGSLLFFGIGVAGHQSKGWQEARTNPGQRAVLASAVASPQRKSCHTGGKHYRKAPEACSYFVSDADWAVFGDSHGVELAYALAAELKPLQQGVRHYTFSGCGPAFQRSSGLPGCSEWTDETVAYIAGNPAIHHVVVSYRLHSALFGDHAGVYPNLPHQQSDAVRAAIWQSLRGLLQRFVDAGKQVVLVMQAPELPQSVEHLVLYQSDPHTVAGASAAWWHARSAFAEQRLGELPPQVRVVRPESHFCDQQRCYAVLDGKALYFDDDHMSLQGAALVARDVVHGASAPLAARP